MVIFHFEGFFATCSGVFGISAIGTTGKVLYNQRHNVINHCDRHITLLNDTAISPFLCLIYLLISICLLGDSKYHSKCKRNFEDIFNRTKDISKSPRWVIQHVHLSQWFIMLSLTVLYWMLDRDEKKIGFCSGYNVPTLFLKSINEVK